MLAPGFMSRTAPCAKHDRDSEEATASRMCAARRATKIHKLHVVKSVYRGLNGRNDAIQIITIPENGVAATAILIRI